MDLQPVDAAAAGRDRLDGASPGGDSGYFRAAGYGLYRLGWLERSPTIRWTLLSGYALASILTFLNVWLAAKRMFASPHDLLLATVLLIFAVAVRELAAFLPE